MFSAKETISSTWKQGLRLLDIYFSPDREYFLLFVVTLPLMKSAL